jgi:hypothetical protein
MTSKSGCIKGRRCLLSVWNTICYGHYVFLYDLHNKIAHTGDQVHLPARFSFTCGWIVKNFYINVTPLEVSLKLLPFNFLRLVVTV